MKERHQYLYFSNINKRWHITQKFYVNKPKFDCIVDYLEKFIPLNPKKVCEWKGDDEFNTYETSCGKFFQLMEGTPKDNEMKFCCYCGTKIKEQRCQ